MKKLNLLFGIIIGIIILSCSSENDNNTNQNTIIGEWQQIKTIEVYFDGTEISEDLTQCEQQGRLTLNSNGILTSLRYYEDDENNCFEDNTFVSGTWENDQSTYNFNFVYFDSENDTNIEITQTPIEVTFPNQNKMLIKDTNNNVENIEFNIAEFIRIN